jgi:hypothetical protein
MSGGWVGFHPIQKVSKQFFLDGMLMGAWSLNPNMVGGLSVPCASVGTFFFSFSVCFGFSLG